MKSSILSVVSEIASLSSGARQISERLMAATTRHVSTSASEEQQNSATILDTASLRNQIALMDRRILELVDALDDASDLDLDDEGRAKFKERVADRLKGTPLLTLAATYDVGYFRAQPRSLRPLIASILVNMFEAKEQQPMDLWQKLSISDGAM